ncbi:hypothetical protein FLLO111716_03480 [Flavobacterium longum]
MIDTTRDGKNDVFITSAKREMKSFLKLGFSSNLRRMSVDHCGFGKSGPLGSVATASMFSLSLYMVELMSCVAQRQRPSLP